MNCYLCNGPIAHGQRVEHHHPVYRSKGGAETRPTHKACHRSYHRDNGDFAAWGRLSAMSCAWAYNLLNVRDNPAYSMERAFYLALYAKGGVN